MRAPWTSRFLGMAVTAVFTAAMGLATSAQAPDPLVGTWKLDLAKSTYKSGPTPKSATVVIDAAGKGIKVAVDAVTADGPMKWSYTSARDGKDAPVTGHPYYQAAAVTQSSPTEGTIVYKNGGKAVVNVKTAVSKDGKTLTVTTSGTDAKGQALSSVAVYAKQ